MTNVIVIAACVSVLVGVDPGNGNSEPPEALRWWGSLFFVFVFPWYLPLTKDLASEPGTRRIALAVWTIVAILFAGYLFLAHAAFLLSSW